MIQPPMLPTLPPAFSPPPPSELPGGPSLTLWRQLAPGHQRQLSQQLAELIRRMRQSVNRKEGLHDDDSATES
jgi:hypothetical protein